MPHLVLSGNSFLLLSLPTTTIRNIFYIIYQSDIYNCVYFISVILVRIRNVKLFPVKCQMLCILSQRTSEHFLEVKLESYNTRFFHIKEDFAFTEVSYILYSHTVHTEEDLFHSPHLDGCGSGGKVVVHQLQDWQFNSPIAPVTVPTVYECV